MNLTTSKPNQPASSAPLTHVASSSLPTYVSVDGSINRKVAFASVGAAFGSIVSLFLATILLNTPLLKDISPEEKGALKASLTSGLTAIATLVVGYQAKPGARDQVVETELTRK